MVHFIRSVCVAVTLVLSCGMLAAQNNSNQAAEAAKKHRAEKSGTATAANKGDANKGDAKNAAKPSGSVAQRLAACKNAAGWNVIKREECVWDLCKGRWGKDGCPAQATGKPLER
jgi:cell division protein FtsX